ncbi:MAG: carboxymuconolactone decarboxylase family protein [Chloroflexi bacterium]|nr:carboxymuconolactone decarboxylase family protein [Chloroflexota bacterium]
MNAFIQPPAQIPFYLRWGIGFAERIARKEMLIGKLLAWYPRAAISSGVLEALIAHHEPGVDERMLNLIRLQASYAVACPFCIDMNSHAGSKLAAEEIAALRGQVSLESVSTFSPRERLAIEYTRRISQTPLKFPQPFIDQLTANFSEREIVILATTAAQVNYWARLIDALGVPPTS